MNLRFLPFYPVASAYNLVPTFLDIVPFRHVDFVIHSTLSWMQLDRKLLKKYFAEHPHESLPEFADKVSLLLKLHVTSYIEAFTFYGMFGME